MKYRVLGSNKSTGAKVSMEFEAESKAAAERKALNANMIVTRVEDITDGAPKHAIVPGGSTRRAGGGGWIKLILVAAVIVVGYLFWHRIRGMLGR